MKLFGYEIQLRKASKKELSGVTAWNSGNAVSMLYSRSKPMLLSAVYRCVDLISSSVAVLPLRTYRLDAGGFKTRYTSHPAYNLLNLEPNGDMTRFTFFKTLMASVLLNGKKLYWLDRQNDLAKLGLWAIRLNFTTENAREVDRVLEEYLVPTSFDPGACTRGLYLRGVE